MKSYKYIGLVVLILPLLITRDVMSNEAELIGLWGGERYFSSGEPIRIVVEKNGEQMLARALGHKATVHIKGRDLTFAFPSGVGSFRGQINKNSNDISGHWISEAGTVVFSPLATPVTLTPTESGIWLGYLQPVDDRFSIYIKIYKDESGEIRAFLRNPERNQGVNTRLHTLKRSATQVQFLDRDGNTILEGQYDLQNDSLSVAMPYRGGTFDLTRRKHATASGFYPRNQIEPYRYALPIAIDDGWSVGDPKSLGLNKQKLEQFVQSIIDTQTTSVRSPYIHSLVIARRNKLVLEEYFYGYHGDRTHDLRSSTKSVTGLMVGRMFDETDSINTNSQVYPLLLNSTASLDASKSALTIDHLLSMRSGFDCDDNDNQSLGNEDRMQSQSEQLDWYKYTLALPFVAQPGESAVYCSGGINLLGGIISQVTQMWLPDFFHSRFALPMQIAHYHINLDPLMRGYAGGGIRMRPRDFLKFAQLVLNKGEWNGQRILSSEWIEQSANAHASIYQADDYGYTWWRGEVMVGDKSTQMLSATGNGGQLLVLIPALELAIGFTGGNYGDFRTWSAWRDKLVPQYVIEAAVN